MTAQRDMPQNSPHLRTKYDGRVYSYEQRIAAARAAVKMSKFTGKAVPESVVELSRQNTRAS